MSQSEITGTKMRTLDGNLESKNTHKIISMKLTDVFHGQNVSVNGFAIEYTIPQLQEDQFQLYNITVCNVFGSRSFIVQLVSSSKYCFKLQKKVI